MNKNIDDVKNFRENNPLFSGESKFEVGSKEFFDEHKKVYIEDVFASNFEKELFIPKLSEDAKVLDLGCGVGFWTIELVERYFYVENVFLNFFPARALPFKIPKFLHRFLSKNMGFMIHLSLRKK